SIRRLPRPKASRATIIDGRHDGRVAGHARERPDAMLIAAPFGQALRLAAVGAAGSARRQGPRGIMSGFDRTESEASTVCWPAILRLGGRPASFCFAPIRRNF